MSSKIFLFGFIFIAFLLFSYIQNFHESINFGSSLTSLSVQSELVYTEMEKINLDISKAQSLDHIQSSIKVREMVPVKSVEFLNIQKQVAFK